jgi:hypothetical protein
MAIAFFMPLGQSAALKRFTKGIDFSLRAIFQVNEFFTEGIRGNRV